MATMKRVPIDKPYLEYDYDRLQTRTATNKIVIHNVGATTDSDTGASWINSYHQKNNDWACIGYHYVIRKNGAVEEGRPHWTVGAHAYGFNLDTIGICVSGNFNIGVPTKYQIESLANLLANICTDYGIPIDREHIVGHKELNVGQTDCPGHNLYAMLDEIVGKANFYQHPPDEITPSLSTMKMTKDQLAHEISLGLINTGIEGSFNSVSCSTACSYPSIGVSQWEGDRADTLLDRIPGGWEFVDSSYNHLVAEGKLEKLKALLDTEEAHKIQVDYLAEDCLGYVEELMKIKSLNDPRCIIYAGMWCPTSTYTVRRFLQNREDQHNYNSLLDMRDLFFEEYLTAASVGLQYKTGYENRAERTYQYVAAIDLTTPYGEPVYGEGPNGR